MCSVARRQAAGMVPEGSRAAAQLQRVQLRSCKVEESTCGEAHFLRSGQRINVRQGTSSRDVQPELFLSTPQSLHVLWLAAAR
jgi:hypothetical protein